MPVSRVALVIVAIITALVVQSSVLARISFLRARPDLVLVVVVCFALIHGPAAGAIIGFGGGLLSDLLSDHLLGLLALVLCVVGYTSGMVRAYLDRLATVTPMLFVGAATAGAAILYSGLALLVGDERITGSALARTVTLTALYDVALTPFVYSALHGLTRRTEVLDRSRT